MQFQITQITNGWIVGHPPTSGSVMINPNQPPQGVAHFCSDYNEVIEYLKTVWPFSVNAN